MAPAQHPAVDLLVDAIRTRLRSPRLPSSAVRGAILEALQELDPPEGRLSSWLSEVQSNSVSVLCRRMGLPMPALPSMAGLGMEVQTRDLAAEIVEALLDELDVELAKVVRQLEVRDARETQVAVRLGMPPRRVRVMARQGREQVQEVLVRLCQGRPRAA